MNAKSQREKNHPALRRDTRFSTHRLWLLWLVALLLATGGTALPATFHVLGPSNGVAGFDPYSVDIHPGDTVQWTWGNSGYAMSVTSGKDGKPDGIFDSGPPRGGPYTFSYTFPNVGTFDYFDRGRTDIVGVIRVVAETTPGLVGNVSTRLPVGVDDNVLIEGFIVQGPAGSTKKIIVRAIGPSLLSFGITDALANPTLEIRNENNATIATNDNWRTTQLGGIITADQSQEINSSGVAPGNEAEAAIIADLAPGSYTAVVAGAGRTIGTGVVDAYDLSAASPAELANIATRGLIQPDDKLMIAGFIIQNGPVKAVIRAIGPSLAAFGIAKALPDTTLQLRDQNGAIVVENDDWKVRTDGSSQQAELEATGLQPTNDLEAAFVTNLLPGQYTAQVRGKGTASGIGVVQVYFLQ
jgi:plastocyanin